ncbi:MAG: hypothetical protein HN981_00335 [Candidatus Pacebacteria bacterium]|jgi:hypothetical protein|nr:hypothetical protein [Candidatus Paceibacterota bacterium]
MATYKQILDEVTRKPGEVWQTDSGNWSGKRNDGTSYGGMKSKDKAQAWVKGADPEKEDEPEKETTPEKEPKKSSSETNVDQPERIIAGKDKALKERDTRTVDSDVYTRDLEPDDEEFDERSKNYNGKDILNPPPPFGFSQESSFMKNKKFPKKYLNVLERAMNCKVAKSGGFEPSWSHFSDEVGGAGRIGAQMGELMTTVGSAMSDEEWGDFKTQMRSHMKQTGRNKREDSDQIIDESWIDSADKTRKRAHDRLKKKFPNAKIPDDIVASGWDTKAEVESMGLDNYDDNKGYSTDYYMKVNTRGPEGVVLDEVSLKKDENANILNSGAGSFPHQRLLGIAETGEPKEEVEKAKKYVELKKKMAKFENSLKSKELKKNKEYQALKGEAKGVFDESKKKISEAGLDQNDFKNDETKSLQTAMSDKSTVNDALKAVKNPKGKQAKLAREELDKYKKKMGIKDDKEAIVAMVELREGNAPDRHKKSMVYLLRASEEVGNKNAQKSNSDRKKHRDEWIANATNKIAEDPMKSGVLRDIQAEFPFKSIAEGEEVLAMGDISVDKFTMESMFGTSDWKEIKEHLKVMPPDKDHKKPYVAYIAEADGKNIPLADIDIREDGNGYKGQMRFDMKINKEFAANAKEASNKVYDSEKKEQYESLEGTISRIKR